MVHLDLVLAVDPKGSFFYSIISTITTICGFVATAYAAWCWYERKLAGRAGHEEVCDVTFVIADRIEAWLENGLSPPTAFAAGRLALDDAKIAYIYGGIDECIRFNKLQRATKLIQVLKQNSPSAIRIDYFEAWQLLGESNSSRWSKSTEEARQLRQESEEKRGMSLQKVRKYTADQPDDPRGWALRADIAFYSHGEDWQAEYSQSLDNAISHGFDDSAIRLLRAQFVSRMNTSPENHPAKLHQAVQDYLAYIADHSNDNRTIVQLRNVFCQLGWTDALLATQEIIDLITGRWRLRFLWPAAAMVVISYGILMAPTFLYEFLGTGTTVLLVLSFFVFVYGILLLLWSLAGWEDEEAWELVDDPFKKSSRLTACFPRAPIRQMLDRELQAAIKTHVATYTPEA